MALPPDRPLKREEVDRMIWSLGNQLSTQHETALKAELAAMLETHGMGRYSDYTEKFVDEWEAIEAPEKPSEKATLDPLEKLGYRKTRPPEHSGFLKCENCKDADWMVVSNPNGVVWGILCVNCLAGYEMKAERKLTLDGDNWKCGLGRKVFAEPKK